MTALYVSFDTRSGQILGVHHGAVDANEVRASAQSNRQHGAQISDEHVAVIQVPPDSVDSQRLYKVDVARKILVSATVQDGGVGFGFGFGEAG
jgi:hypothetical protein